MPLGFTVSASGSTVTLPDEMQLVNFAAVLSAA